MTMAHLFLRRVTLRNGMEPTGLHSAPTAPGGVHLTDRSTPLRSAERTFMQAGNLSTSITMALFSRRQITLRNGMAATGLRSARTAPPMVQFPAHQAHKSAHLT